MHLTAAVRHLTLAKYKAEPIDPGVNWRKLPDCNGPCLIRMLGRWLSHCSSVPRHSSLSAVRTLAVMSVPHTAQSQWGSRPGNQQIPPYEVYSKHIIRSERDERDYRVIRLRNGLQAMLVHDLKADKAAASLDVAVGHLYDPVSYAWTLGRCRAC